MKRKISKNSRVGVWRKYRRDNAKPMILPLKELEEVFQKVWRELE